MKKQIEGLYPLKEINRICMMEKMTKDHPGNIHLWWNRSPMQSSSALLQAALQDESSDGNIAQDITVVDPFSGSGNLTVAALQSGLPVMAGDLNSVAAAITKAVAEVPSLFINNMPVSPEAEVKLYTGFQGLAEDVCCYGTWVRDKLRKRLASCYPSLEQEEASNYAWIWTRTVPCPNPACGCRMPLAVSYVLSRQKGREYYVEPIVQDDHVEFVTLKGAPDEALNGNKIGKKGAQFRCPKCGTITKDEYVKQVGCAGNLGIQLMAVGVTSEEGRIYISPDAEQIEAAKMAVPQDLPVGELPANTRWFSPPLFGLKSYSDLYTPRQLLLLSTLCDLVGEASAQCRQDAIAAGLVDDNVPLVEGGSGALAYSQAIGLYLSFVIGKLANFQSSVCTWDNRHGNVRAAFTRQAIPMTWVFAEGDPFSSVTGNYNSMLSDVISAVESLKLNSSATVVQADALQFPFPKNSLLFTELPYYDNVGYADLSDYFYVWLRRCMKGILPGYFDAVVSSKQELSSIAEHFGGNAQLAVQSYEEWLRSFFLRFQKFATDEAPSIVFFEFGKKPEQWEGILDAIVQAGFQVTAILPVRTEPPKENYETFRAAIVFRPRNEEAPQGLRRVVVGEIKRDLPGLLEARFQVEVDEYDRPLVGVGCGLSLFSSYARVLNADGSVMTMHDALQVIWSVVIEFLQ